MAAQLRAAEHFLRNYDRMKRFVRFGRLQSGLADHRLFSQRQRNDVALISLTLLGLLCCALRLKHGHLFASEISVSGRIIRRLAIHAPKIDTRTLAFRESTF
jgi:hypothetical protein